MAQVRGGGFWSRAKAFYPPDRVPTVEALEARLKEQFPGYQVYRSKLMGLDLVAKRSGWSGMGFRVTKDGVKFGPFAPSTAVRILFMGVIPIVILWFARWKKMLAEFRAWFEADGPTEQAAGARSKSSTR